MKISKQVIVIRNDLKMGKGKMVSQGAHASTSILIDRDLNFGKISKSSKEALEDWVRGTFTKICVYVNSEKELLEIYNKAKSANLLCSIIRDNGKTEFGGVHTYTAVAIGPDWSEVVDEITKELKLL
jgi:PTH2 family peptidyl-tRNA hydrolase